MAKVMPRKKATGKGYKPIKVSDNYTIRANSYEKLKREVHDYQVQRRRMIAAVRKEYPGVSEQELEDHNIIPPKRYLKDVVGGIRSKRDLEEAYRALEFPLKKGYLKRRQVSAGNAILEALTRSTAASDEELSAIEKAMSKMDAMQLAGWRLQHPDLVKDVFDWYRLNRDMVTDDADTVRLRTRILDSFGITYRLDKDIAGDKYIVPGTIKQAPRQTKLTDKPKKKKR